RAYPTVREIPDGVDLAFVAVPAADVVATIDDCAAAGVKAAVVLSAGFAETDDQGRARQEQLLAHARGHGIRVVGPNCLGVVGTDPACEINGTFGSAWPPAGGVAFGSQSGAF